VYGISARKRARLIATDNWRWKCVLVPVIRAGMILPFSLMKSFRIRRPCNHFLDAFGSEAAELAAAEQRAIAAFLALALVLAFTLATSKSWHGSLSSIQVESVHVQHRLSTAASHRQEASNLYSLPRRANFCATSPSATP
jgi:hypothetical protein